MSRRATSRSASPPSLAERLGHSPDARLLVVNADDLGSINGANAAILDGFRRGAVTSTSLMVPCPWAPAAARSVRPRHDVGVHLTVTSEWIGYRWPPLTDARSLRAKDGRMHRTVEACQKAVRRAGARGYDEVRAECRAQIEQALAWKVDVTHLDAHMGTMQLAEDFFDIYLDLAEEYGLPLRMISASGERALGFPARERAAARGVLYPDHLVFTYLDARPILERAVASLRPGVTEIMLHPALDSPDLRAGFPDADERVANHAFATEPDGLRALVAEHGVTLIGYRAIRDLQRGLAA